MGRAPGNYLDQDVPEDADDQVPVEEVGEQITPRPRELEQEEVPTILDEVAFHGADLAGGEGEIPILTFCELYGEGPFYYFFSDNAKEPKAAAEQELIAHRIFTSHRPESNGVVERSNKLIVDGTRCLLRTPKQAARSILALRVQGCPSGAQRQRLLEGQGRTDRLGPALRQGVPR